MKSKIFLQIGSAALAAALMAGCSLFQNDDSEATSATTGSRPDAVTLSGKYSGYGFQALQTVGEQRLYDAIDSAVKNPYSKDFVTDSLDDEKRATDVLEFYIDDHPDVFWIDETEPYYYSVDGGDMTVLLKYKYEGDELEKAKAALDEKVQAAVAGAPQNASDYEKELYVHDYLVDSCAYDEEAVESHKNDTVRANEQNAYGALVDGTAVCEGYTRAFQLLCEKLGVECWVVQGQALGFEGQENTSHIWNCVQLEGNWYHVDVTWDDCDIDDTASAEMERYMYFNLTTEMVEEDHIIAPAYSEYTGDNKIWYNGYIPQCDSTDYYYYNLNALTVNDLDSDECASFLAKSAADRDDYCYFIIGEYYDFNSAFDEITQGYAYQWMTAANEENGYDPKLSEDCKLSSIEDRRIVVMILKYE